MRVATQDIWSFLPKNVRNRLLLGGDGAAFIRTPKEGGAHAAH